MAKASASDTGRRLDIWLWFARFYKSRTIATKFVHSGRLRVNGTIVKKAHHLVRPDDVLTFPKADQVRVVKVLDLGVRRGPATEAQDLYEDLSPPAPRNAAEKAEEIRRKPAAREPGSGRPTKQQRRALDRLRGD